MYALSELVHFCPFSLLPSPRAREEQKYDEPGLPMSSFTVLQMGGLDFTQLRKYCLHFFF